MQDDAHSPLLTVKETLEFAAMLRMRIVSRALVENHVAEVMKLLGIEAIAETFIGTDECRTISRGQLRRVTIGCEIVNSSSLIFLDEVRLIFLLILCSLSLCVLSLCLSLFLSVPSPLSHSLAPSCSQPLVSILTSPQLL
jgi:ABC-type enterochelin transport system ATPase subunit